MANKQELLHFLDSHVFDPILHTSPDRFSEADRKRPEDVRKRTEAEKARFHRYDSAEQLIVNYRRDLHSRAAKHVNDGLESWACPRSPR
jgi:hypothetical protein